jgi:alkylation response protein AidB-like acyl-CoA dehydrogenase
VWIVAPLREPARLAEPAGAPLGTRLGPFVTDLDTSGDAPTRATVAGSDADVSLYLALTAASILGTCDRAVEVTVEHVNGRIQFGKPIAAFQAVQFQLADAAVAVAGLRELLHFTLWRLTAAPDLALTDALALRVHAVDVARQVLRTCQQLHGAAGVCDEYDVSVLTRLVQPALRLPWSAERTATELSEAIQRDGFDGLFAHGGAHG